MDNVTRRTALGLMAATGLASTVLAGCARQHVDDKPTDTGDVSSSAEQHLRILATSDMHGMFVPWDYALDTESMSGSVAQLSSAVKELRDEDTLLIDAGDIIQDNMADFFLDDEVHPMIACMNAIGYDIGITGNHEFNYGMDVVRKTVASFDGTVLTGNVIDEHGDPIADGYTIIDRNGLRIGIIGMVTPLITHWDKLNLEGCKVTDPVEETRKIIDQIADDVDVLIGVMHMGVENEYGIAHTGVRDLVMECPEFDVVVAAHQHLLIEGEEINDVLVVENSYHAQTLCIVDLTVTRDGDRWKVKERTSSSVDVGTYEPDPDIVELAAPYDERAKARARERIGTLEGGPLAPPNEIKGIPQAAIEDTALLGLINRVQLHYSGADVAASAVFDLNGNIEPGPIRRCDTSVIYRFNNTLYTLDLTGAQLRKYMEWSASKYRQYQPGDLTLAFEPETRPYDVDMLSDVSYQVNVAKPVGERIEGLSWPDGSPVADGDVFVLATNNYRANTQLLTVGELFEEDDLPRLREMDVCGNIGGVRELIADYIENVSGGTITSEVDGNWRIVGNDWDPELHQQVVDLLAEGRLTLEAEEGRSLISNVITEEDLQKALA